MAAPTLGRNDSDAVSFTSALEVSPQASDMVALPSPPVVQGQERVKVSVSGHLA